MQLLLSPPPPTTPPPPPPHVTPPKSAVGGGADGLKKAMANGWRRRRRRSLMPTTMALMVALIWPFLALLAMTAEDHQQQQQKTAPRAHRRADPGFRAQRICYQCQMPMQCQSGFCYGDFCVKSMVADKYVSKGCENRTMSAPSGAFYAPATPSKALQSHGPLYARSAATMAEGGGAQVPSHAIGIAPGCVKMRVFGVQNTVCYCDDSDYCNGGGVGVRPPPVALATVAAMITAMTTTASRMCCLVVRKRWWW